MTFHTVRRIVITAIIGAILALLALSFTSRQASAQMFCAPLPDILAGLQRKFHELPIWSGENATHKYIITADGERSWTIMVISKENEAACFAATGKKNTLDRGI